MEIGLGAMNMAPDDFWGQSVHEWDARVAGFMEMHGAGEAAPVEPMSRDDLERLMEEHPD